MIATPSFLALAIFAAFFILFLIFYARSLLKNGIMKPNGQWLSPATPGFRRKVMIGVSLPCFVAVVFIAIGLTASFAPQTFMRAVIVITRKT